MADKLHVIIAYVILGLALCSIPILLSYFSVLTRNSTRITVRNIFIFSILFFCIYPHLCRDCLANTFGNRLFIFFMYAVTTTLICWNKKNYSIKNCILAFSGMLVSAILPWWRIGKNRLLTFDTIELVLFSVAILISTYLLLWKGSRKKKKKYLFIKITLVLLYCALASVFVFSTQSFYNDSFALYSMWHHWSAYIGPAALLKSGGRILYDFPAQYGLGPTLLLAFGASSPWLAMYVYCGLATLFCFGIVSWMALTLSAGRNTINQAIILALSGIVCLLWVAAPYYLVTPLSAPSTFALRFFPVLMLVFYLFQAEQRVAPTNARRPWAYGLWALGGLWSPESLFYVTFIWWPFALFLTIRAHGTNGLWPALLARILSLLGVAAVYFGLVVGIYRLVYGIFPDPFSYAAYALYPPGVMSIDEHGTICFFFAVLLVGIYASIIHWRTVAYSNMFSRNFLLILLLYGVFAYYLGRSHDNNILNLSPYMFLVLVGAYNAPIGRGLRFFSAVLLGCFFGWMVVFNWSEWKSIQKIEFNPERLIQQMSWDTRHGPVYGDIEKSLILQSASKIGYAKEALDYIRGHGNESIFFADKMYVLMSSLDVSPWCSIYGPENYVFLPSSNQEMYLSRFAKHVPRSGWLIVDTDLTDNPFENSKWLTLFDSIYERDTQISFGSYLAIRYIPKYEQ